MTAELTGFIFQNLESGEDEVCQGVGLIDEAEDELCRCAFPHECLTCVTGKRGVDSVKLASMGCNRLE